MEAKPTAFDRATSAPEDYVKPKLSRATAICALFVFIAFTLLLWYHAAPSVSFHDSGEFVLAAATGGLPHPPGAPTWVLGAMAFLKIGQFADPAYGCNLYSGMWGAATLALMFMLSMKWIRLSAPAISWWQSLPGSFMPPLILLHSPAFIEQSLITEQYTLLTALQLAMLTLFVKAADEEAATPAQLAAYSGGIGLIWGLAIGNHPSQICLIVPIGWFVYRVARQYTGITLRRAVISLLTSLLIGLCVFFYLPYVALKSTPPAMDWIKADSLERVFWALQRKLWETRPLSEVPQGFVREWFLTYDFIGQLGVVAFVLALAGFAWGLLTRWSALVWLALIVFPYAGGLFLAHLRQANIDIFYLKVYGVQDWHLPLYIMASFAVIPLFVIVTKRFRRNTAAIISTLIACYLAVASLFSLSANSLRGWKGPQNYLEDLTSSIPEQSVIVAGGDSLIFMLGYQRFLSKKPQKYDLYFQTHYLDKTTVEDGLTTAKLVQFFEATINAPRQPYRKQTKSSVNDPRTPLLMSYNHLNNNLVPSGLLCRFAAGRTTDSILLAEAVWRRANPPALREPTDSSHRLEREAFGLAYLYRGNFFRSVGLVDLAIEEYSRSVKWLPYSYTWVALGLAYEAQDRIRNRDRAKICYEAAIQFAPTEAEAYFRLGTLLVNSGRVSEGLKCLNQCLLLDPSHKEAATNRQFAESLN